MEQGKRPRTVDTKVDPEIIRVLFDCDPDTGTLIWRERPRDLCPSDDRHKQWNTRFAGKIVGGQRSREYLTVIFTVNGIQVSTYAHRIVWCWVHGEWPRYAVDHIDGDGMNNRISNLRDVPQAENTKNQSIRRKNQSGVIGVAPAATAGKWKAEIRADRIRRHLGTFDTLAEAAAARKAAERELGFHANHGRKLTC